MKRNNQRCRHSALIAALIGVMLLLNTGSVLADESFTVVDCAGRTVRLEKKAKRIIDLTFAEGSRTLLALEAQDLLVGLSDMVHGVLSGNLLMSRIYAVLPVAAPELAKLPNIGSPKEPNIESVLALKPDVIFVAWSRKRYADVLQKQIGIPVICVGGYGSFNYEIFTVAGKVIGREDRANQLINYTKAKIAKISALTKDIPDNHRKRIFYWTRPVIGSPMTNGRYEAFEAAGTINVATMAKMTPYGVFKVTKEQILAWNPDLIFKQSAFVENPPGWHTLESIRDDAIVRHTKAGQNRQVFPTRGHMRGWDIATEAVEVLYIAKIAYPERFKHLDATKEGDEILKMFYGRENLFSDMSEKTGLVQWN